MNFRFLRALRLVPYAMVFVAVVVGVSMFAKGSGIGQASSSAADATAGIAASVPASTDSGATTGSAPSAPGSAVGPSQPAAPGAQAGPSAPAGSGAPATSNTPTAAGFSDSFTGTATESQSGGLVQFNLRATATGEQELALEVNLVLVPGRNGSSTARSNNMVVSTTSGSTLCSGQVEELTDEGMVGTCQGSGSYQGKHITLIAQFDSGLGDQVSGTLDATITG